MNYLYIPLSLAWYIVGLIVLKYYIKTFKVKAFNYEVLLMAILGPFSFILLLWAYSVPLFYALIKWLFYPVEK